LPWRDIGILGAFAVLDPVINAGPDDIGGCIGDQDDIATGSGRHVAQLRRQSQRDAGEVAARPFGPNDDHLIGGGAEILTG
jgi:hypothetical protein